LAPEVLGRDFPVDGAVEQNGGRKLMVLSEEYDVEDWGKTRPRLAFAHDCAGAVAAHLREVLCDSGECKMLVRVRRQGEDDVGEKVPRSVVGVRVLGNRVRHDELSSWVAVNVMFDEQEPQLVKVGEERVDLFNPTSLERIVDLVRAKFADGGMGNYWQWDGGMECR
jgi:hypothetical protein